MRTLRRIAELRSALSEPRRAGQRIGLVPTMGAFHDGHLSLMRRARSECDVVIVSLFVNPTQFNETGDLAAYPRDEERDSELAAQAGVDYLFVPAVEEMYPSGFATTVSVAGLSDVLEGEHRGRRHFDAVATVVAKLFNIVGPDAAYFGQKDAQQVLVIQRMVRDLALAPRIVVCPTVREADGLAMSSRNRRLSGDDRRRAAALHRALERLREAVAAGERDPAAASAPARAELGAAAIDPDYLEIVSPDDLTSVTSIDGEVLAVIAAHVNGIRLIDNELIQPVPAGQTGGSYDGRAASPSELTESVA
jgi:pantoate--beta-alanine ligase